MKLFQQLLVAPAALGLVAPMAASAAPSVSDYSDTIEEVQSISQFSDVYPSDWAYKALIETAQRHGCVTATPSGAMTRYEAAALLNNCIGNVAQVNEEERRLLSEFGPELAVIKGRLDGLEARMGEYEASQFSTTTRLTGKTTFTVGSQDRDGENDTDARTDATTFSYTTQLNLNTSFNGDDLLYTRFKYGNASSTWTTKTYGAYLVNTSKNADAITLDKLWYQFAVGENLKFWVGPKVENYYMLASAPSIYRPVFKQFANGGNTATYNASTGGGFGAAWVQDVTDRSQPRWAVSANYVAADADNSNPGDGNGGLLNNSGKGIFLTKVEYGSPKWQVSVAYSVQDDGKNGGEYYATTDGHERTGSTTYVGVRGYWRPETTGVIPSISGGFDIGTVDDDGTSGATESTATWMIGMNWSDAFVDGNTAGIAFGKRQWATSLVGTGDDPADDNFTYEVYYTFKVSDSISITPAVMVASDPANGTDDDTVAGVINTVFKF